MVIMDSGQQITVGNRKNDFHSFPDNWQLCSLGEITTSSQYGISSSSGGNYSVPILKMNNLQDGHIDLGNLDYIHLSKAEMESLKLKKGDLLINRTNSPDLVGKAAVYDLAGEHVFASYLVRFRLGPSVLPAFVNYFLNSEPGQRKLKLLSTKAVSQANINPSILKRRLFVPIPPILEQHRIVEILSALDHSIDLTKQLIAKKRDIKRATMQQLLSGKTRLPGFSEEWEVRKLGDVSEIKTGKKNNEDEIESGAYPFFVRSQTVERINTYSFDGEGGIGNIIHYINGKFDYHQRVYKISGFGNDLCGKFVYFCMLQNFNNHATRNSVKATVDSLRLPTFQEFEFFAPSFKEQQAIAAILTDMDAEIAALEQKRDKTRALKQGMMQELLTGKTRLL